MNTFQARYVKGTGHVLRCAATTPDRGTDIDDAILQGKVYSKYCSYEYIVKSLMTSVRKYLEGSDFHDKI